MPEVKFTGETILMIIAGIVIVAEIISALAKGRQGWGEISGRNQRNAEMTTINQRLTTLETDMSDCKRELSDRNKDYKAVRKDLSQVMDVLDGMLLHFISGNDKEKLKSVKEGLDHYKSRRGMEEEE